MPSAIRSAELGPWTALTAVFAVHGLLRHHFGSKEDIWRAVIDAALQKYLSMLLPFIGQATTQHTATLPTVKAASRLVIKMSAQYSEVPRLLMYEGVTGGPRLRYFMDQMAPLHVLMIRLVRAVQQKHALEHLSPDTYWLFLLMLGAMPFALIAFSNELWNTDMLKAEQVQEHTEQVLRTLFPGM